MKLVEIYLGLLILSGLVGISALTLKAIKRRPRKGESLASAWKSWLREALRLVVGVVFLALFTLKIIGPWIAVITTGVLLILLEYAMALAVKLRLRSNGNATLIAKGGAPEEQGSTNWKQIRAKGKLRFVLRRTIAYGLIVVPPFLLLGAATPQKFSIYLQGMLVMVLAFALGGYTSAIGQWNWNEQKFRQNKG